MWQLIRFFILTILISSCSTIKLMDSWSSKDFQAIKKKKILVAAKNPDLKIRKTYEIAIANKLRNQGIDAIEIHKKFPDFEEKKTLTKEEETEIIQLFTNEGITGVMVASLKNTIETNNFETPKGADIPREYRDKYFFSYSKVDDISALPNLDSIDFDDPPEVAIKSTTYVLETVTYDLSLAKEKQLVNVCLIDVTDPDSGSQVLSKFSKIVSDQFKK